MHHDYLIPRSAICAVLDISKESTLRRLAARTMPPPDQRLARGVMAWRLSTIRLWRPDAAARLERGIRHKVFKAAA